MPPECNPLQGGACLAPWPVSSYLTANEASSTGVVLDVPVGAVPANGDGLAFEPVHLNGKSGYSPATQIVAHFGVALDSSNLAGPSAIAASVTAASSSSTRRSPNTCAKATTRPCRRSGAISVS